MIRTSEHRFSVATNAERVCAEIMLKQEPERDGERHNAIALWCSKNPHEGLRLAGISVGRGRYLMTIAVNG
jgi:hypothetical protein